MQPGLAVATDTPPFATRLPGNGIAFAEVGFGVRRVVQAHQISQRPAAFDLPGILGKGHHIEPKGVEITHGHALKCTGREWENPDHDCPQLTSFAAPEGRFSPFGRPGGTDMTTARPTLILASTSRYRRELLERLRLPFRVESPEVDETPLPGERPAELAQRLALAKARAIAAKHPDAVVIGSDQVADLDGVPVGKPGTHERALEQLRAMSGRSIVFQTAVAVVCEASGFAGAALVPVTVRFRRLGEAEIEHYLRTEQPYDCAGSAKSETLGIALLDAIESDDPSALVGLPLIHTCALLRQAGIDPLKP